MDVSYNTSTPLFLVDCTKPLEYTVCACHMLFNLYSAFLGIYSSLLLSCKLCGVVLYFNTCLHVHNSPEGSEEEDVKHL